MSKKKEENKIAFGTGIVDVLNQVNKKYGPDTFLRLSDIGTIPNPRLSSGIFSFDVALGGGVPRGKFSLYFGEYSSGKTSLALKVLTEAQLTCRNCSQRLDDHWLLPKCECDNSEPMMVVILDAEGTFDRVYATKFGLDLEKAFLITPEYAEQGIDVADAVLRSGECDIMLIDSFAELTPSVEVSESAEDWQMGVHARLMNKLMRKMKSALNSFGPSIHRPTVIGINQPRLKIGIVWGSPETMPGGKGIPLAASVIVKLKRAEVLADEFGNTWGQLTTVDIPKNKTGAPFRSCKYRMWVANNVDNTRWPGYVDTAHQVAEFATWWQLVEKSGSWLSAQVGDRTFKAQGADKFGAQLGEDPEALLSLAQQVLECERRGIAGTQYA